MSRAALIGLLLVTACDTRVLARDYEQSCAADGDCVVVAEGELCGACGPALKPAAINRVDLARFQAERTGLTCPPRLGPLPPCAPPDDAPPPAVAGCNAGTCTVH